MLCHLSALQRRLRRQCPVLPARPIPDQPRDIADRATRRASAAGKTNERPNADSQEHDFWQELE
jgi:hypothetical protein